jgi:hypothetical protein
MNELSSPCADSSASSSRSIAARKFVVLAVEKNYIGTPGKTAFG